MKKLIFTIVMTLGITTQVMAMSVSTIRNHARFISDRMAYELDLTPMQYDDCYEINYDFIYQTQRIMNDVVYGYRDAIETYYRLLDYRNDDLRYVLSNRQYTKFITLDYFYRPIYTVGRNWNFRIYTIYNNKKFFYYDAPSGYKTYNNGHSARGYYNNRYQHERYQTSTKIYGSNNYGHAGRNDFGTVRRDRNNKNDVKNNYSNPNQSNRTRDARYEDKSGNKNSPQINNRQNGNGTQQGNNNGKTHFNYGNDNNRQTGNNQSHFNRK